MIHKRENLLTRKEWHTFRIGRKRDRRIKLTDEQRKEIWERYKRKDIGMRPLARQYGVSRTTIRTVVQPEWYKRKLQERKDRKLWLHYYDKDKHRKYLRAFRSHIREILKETN